MPPETVPLEKPSSASSPEAESIGARYTSVSETIEQGADPHEVHERARKLQEVVMGRQAIPAPVAAQLAQEHFFLNGKWEQVRGEAKKFIPNHVFDDVNIQREVKKIQTALQQGTPLTQLMHEAYQAGVKNDLTPLLALKNTGARLIQRLGPENKQQWKAMSEETRQAVRLAEMMVMGVQMNFLSLQRQKKAIPPATAEFWITQFAKYAKNDDLPDRFRQDLTLSSERLQKYYDDKTSIHGEPPATAGDTQKASASETVVEPNQGRALIPRPPVIEGEVVDDPNAIPERQPNPLPAYQWTTEQRKERLGELRQNLREYSQRDIDSTTASTIIKDFFNDKVDELEKHEPKLLWLIGQEKLASPSSEDRRQRYLDILDNELGYMKIITQGGVLSRVTLTEQLERAYARFNVSRPLLQLVPFAGRRQWREVMEARSAVITSMRSAARKITNDNVTESLLEQLADHLEVAHIQDGQRYQQNFLTRLFKRLQ